MRHFFRSFNWKDYIFFLICGIAYYILIRQYISVNWDDLSYRFICGSSEREYIDSVSSIFNSQVWHYQNVNGRFLVHCFVQFFCGFGGDLCFFVGTTLMFLLLLMSGVYLIRKGTETAIINFDKELFVLLLILFCPLFGTTFLGTKAFVVNYMWSASVYMCYIALYKHIKEDNVKYVWWQNILLFIYALLVGSWQESFAIPIAGMLFVYHLINLRRTKGSLLVIVIGFGVGTLVHLFAPSNLNRSASTGLSITSDVFYIATQILRHVVVVDVILIVLLWAIMLDWKRKQKSFIIINYVYILPIILSLMFALIISFYGGAYQLTIIGICSTILVIRFISTYYHIPTKYNVYIKILLFVLLIMWYIPSFIFREKLHSTFNDFTTSVIKEPAYYVTDTNFEKVARMQYKNKYFRDKCVTFELLGSFSNEIVSGKLGCYLSKGKDTLCHVVLPEPKEMILAHCTEDNLIASSTHFGLLHYKSS